MMDNRIFNVNGCGLEMLQRTLCLAFEQEGSKATGYQITKHGMILIWGSDPPAGVNRFPVPLEAPEVAPIVFKWLSSPQDSQEIQYTGWDADADHDGENKLGWRVYVGDWGHVGDETYSICAIKPAFLWLGK